MFAGSDPPQRMSGMPISQREKSQNADRHHRAPVSQQAQMVLAPRGPLQRHRIDRAGKRKDQKKDLHRPRQPDAKNINHDERQYGCRHLQPSMLHAANDFPGQLRLLGHQTRSDVLQAEIDDGLQPLRNRCRQRVDTQDDHAPP